MVTHKLPDVEAEPRPSIAPDSPLANAIGDAAGAVAAAFSELCGVEVHCSRPRVDVLPLRELARVGGAPGDSVVALFLTYSGSDTGQIMLVYDLEQARILADQMLWNPPGTTIEMDEMAQSALVESGNILAAHFLTAIADLTGARLEISTPSLLADFRGAALNVPIAAVAGKGDTFLSIQSDFHGDCAPAVGATLLVVPDHGFNSTLIRSLA